MERSGKEEETSGVRKHCTLLWLWTKPRRARVVSKWPGTQSLRLPYLRFLLADRIFFGTISGFVGLEERDTIVPAPNTK